MNKLKNLALAAATALALTAPMGAQAELQLCLDDTGDAVANLCISDGGAGDGNIINGVITFIGAVGGFFLNVSTAIGEPAFQGGFGMDLNSVNGSMGAGTLIVSMSQNDLDFGTTGTPVQVGGAIGGTVGTGGSISYALYASDNNTLFGMDSLVFSGSSGPSAFSATGGSPVSLSDPFSLSTFVTITHPREGANTSFDFEAKVPEPATLALLGLGLAGLGLSTRRRRTPQA